MTAVTVINVFLPIIATLALITAGLFIFRAIQQRSSSSRAAYNVGRQEARQAMQADLMRSVVALAVGLVLFGVYLLLPQPTEAESAPTTTLTPPAVVPTVTAVFVTDTPPAPPTSVPSSTASPTVVLLTPTPPATATVVPETVPTETPAVQTAVVTSGVGVWLRSAPSLAGEQVEWLLPQTEVTLLAGQAAADEFEWQQVQAPSGNTGWVAVPFIQLIEE